MASQLTSGRATSSSELGNIAAQLGGSTASNNAALSSFAPVGASITVPPPSTVPAMTPVVTAADAEKDYQAKLANYNQLKDSIQQQGSLLAQQAAQRAADQAQKDLQTSEANLKQQGVDIQKQQADTAAKDTDLKRAALSMSDSTSVTGNTYQPPQTAPITTPVPQTNTDTLNQGLDQAVSTKIGGLQDIQDQRDSITAQSNQALQSLLQGTIPLSPPQTALISSLQNQLTQNENDQKQANTAYTGAVTEAGFRSGGEYTPEQYAGQIHAAVSLGVSKIQNLDNSAAQTMANLEQSFQKDNFDIINKQFDNLSKTLDDKATALQDMYKTVTDSLKDQRDFQYKAQQDAQNFGLAVDKYKLDVANSAVDNNLKRAQAAKVYSDLAANGDPADLSSAQSWVKNIQSGVAKFTDVPAALKNAVSVGIANGTPQGSNQLLTTTKQALDDLNSKVTNNQGFSGAVGAKGPSSLFGLRSTPFAGTQAANFDAKLKQTVNDVVLPNLTILHGLGRVTDREFQALQSSITSLNTNLSEDEFKKELKNVTDTIDQKIADTQPEVTKSSVQNALTSGYSPDQIVSEYMKDPSMAPKIQAAQKAGYSSQEIIDYYSQ